MVRKIAFIFILVSPAMLRAQTSTLPLDELKKDAASEVAPPKPVDEHKDVERVEVTGSHIKRIDTEGASPITTITRKDLEKSGYNSVADVLRDSAMDSFGSTRESANTNAPGNAEVSLRGLGADNTLVLLNGQRLPTDAVSGAVDINLIPMAAVERVEILKDGASAIYGSDALGGVVNIITRKDFSGSEVSTSQTTPALSGGQKNDISLVNGFNKGRLNMVNVVQYRDNKALYSRDRSWSNHGISETSNNPSYQQGSGQSYASPACPPSMIKHTSGGDVCTFNYTNYQQELPDLKQFSMLSESNIEVSSKVKMTARLMGTDRQARTILAPAPGSLTIPAATAATFGLPNYVAGQDLNITYRTMPLGNREDLAQTYSLNALVGATVEMPHDWQLEMAGSHNAVQTSKSGYNGYALNQKIVDAIVAGQCNPFDPNKPCNLDSARYNPLESTTSQLTSFDTHVTGQLAKWSAGSLSLAMGGTVSYEKYTDSFDEASVNGQVYGNAGSSGAGGRSMRSAYTELSVPIVKSLELQIAERYDHYSDFGDTTNPKAAILIHASKSVLIRASAGTGFKAPLMQELYAATSSGYPGFIDHVACDYARQHGLPQDDCMVQQHLVTSGGNKDLREERSVSYSTGVVFEPNKDFNISTDFFMIRNKNVVNIDYEDMTLAESKGINLKDFGINIVRDPTTQKLVSVVAPLQNLSAQELTGVDVSGSYRLHKWRLSTEQSQMFWFKEEGFPGVGYRNKLGEHGRPPWRNATGLTYAANERHDFTLAALTTAGQEKTIPEAGRLRNYTELEFQYAYNTKKIGTFSAGVKNLLGATPPIDDSDPTAPLNASIYDQIGQQYYTAYKATF